MPILSAYLDRLLKTIAKDGSKELQVTDSLLLAHYDLISQRKDQSWQLTEFGFEYLKKLPPNYPLLKLGALDFDPPSVIDDLLSNKPLLTKHLHAVLKKIAENGVKDIPHPDVADLVLYGYVTFKFLRGWVISKEGSEYLEGNSGDLRSSVG